MGVDSTWGGGRMNDWIRNHPNVDMGLGQAYKDSGGHRAGSLTFTVTQKVFLRGARF